jgi:hypothetical protein
MLSPMRFQYVRFWITGALIYIYVHRHTHTHNSDLRKIGLAPDLPKRNHCVRNVSVQCCTVLSESRCALRLRYLDLVYSVS